MKRKIDGREIAKRNRRLASGRFLEPLRDTCGELGEKTKGKKLATWTGVRDALGDHRTRAAFRHANLITGWMGFVNVIRQQLIPSA